LNWPGLLTDLLTGALTAWLALEPGRTDLAPPLCQEVVVPALASVRRFSLPVSPAGPSTVSKGGLNYLTWLTIMDYRLPHASDTGQLGARRTALRLRIEAVRIEPGAWRSVAGLSAAGRAGARQALVPSARDGWLRRSHPAAGGSYAL